jgi:hypothetical protein
MITSCVNTLYHIYIYIYTHTLLVLSNKNNKMIEIYTNLKRKIGRSFFLLTEEILFKYRLFNKINCYFKIYTFNILYYYKSFIISIFYFKKKKKKGGNRLPFIKNN